MDDRRFDTLTRMIGQGASRRSVLKGLLGISGTAVAGTAVAKGVEARAIGSRPTVTTPVLPTCLLPKQMCGADCCEPGKCKDGHCCPKTTDAWCGDQCWPADLCTSTGDRCDEDERVCGAVCCAATASCTRSGNTDTCCDPGEANQFPCGWECCASEELCCDRECCPAGHACLTRLTGGETGLIEEELCCPTDLVCHSVCCLGGVCYDPNTGAGGDESSEESSAEEEQQGGSELLCCPSASAICEGASRTLCCDAGTECCVDESGIPYCLNPNQCCRDAQCAGSGNPETCSIGACNLETRECEAGATSCDAANFEQCCGSNICCRGICCGDPPDCCDNFQGETCCDGVCTEIGTDENCSECGNRCVECEYCGQFGGLVQCGHEDIDPQNRDGEICGQCLLCSGGTCESPDPVCLRACTVNADCFDLPVELVSFPCYECSTSGFCVTVDPPFAVQIPDLFNPIGYCCADPGTGQLVYNATGFEGEGCCFDSHCGGDNVCCSGHCDVPMACAGTPEPTTTTSQATTTTLEALIGGEPEVATGQTADLCSPETCESLIVTCGVHDDGCGGTVDCGPCCTPRDYCMEGECGLVDDGCAGMVDCGECPLIDTATTTPPEPTTSAPLIACLAERARCVDDGQCCEGLCRDRSCGARGRRQCTKSC